MDERLEMKESKLSLILKVRMWGDKMEERLDEIVLMGNGKCEGSLLFRN